MPKPYPIPPNMTVAELGSDYLWARCPNGHNSRQMNEAFLERRYAADARLVAIVKRMVCEKCRARAVGEIEPCPRSGAEGIATASSPSASPPPAPSGRAPRTDP